VGSLNLFSSVNTHKYAPEQILSKTVSVYRCNLYVELFYHVYIYS